MLNGPCIFSAFVSFSVKRADKEDIKRLLAVYFEQNVITEWFEDFDGERWIIPDD